MLILLKKEGVDELLNDPIPNIRGQTDKWKADDAKCMQLIVAHLSDNMLNVICLEKLKIVILIYLIFAQDLKPKPHNFSIFSHKTWKNTFFTNK